MSRAIPLLPLWAFMACYRENFTLLYFYCRIRSLKILIRKQKVSSRERTGTQNITQFSYTCSEDECRIKISNSKIRVQLKEVYKETCMNIVTHHVRHSRTCIKRGSTEHIPITFVKEDQRIKAIPIQAWRGP
jgi:hypothetical protein